MDELWDLILVLWQDTPPSITIGITLVSGLVLNYLGVKFFAGLSNSTLLATGAMLAVFLASELLWEGNPASTWAEKALLPFGVWVASALPSYLDGKLHLSILLNFLVAATICGILVLSLWIILLGDAGFALSHLEMLAALGISAVVVGVGALIIVKIETSKPLLLLVCVLSGSMLIGNGCWNLAALLKLKATMIPPEAFEVQTKSLLCPWKCLALVRDAGLTIQEVFPWAEPVFLVIPITGIIVQARVLLRQWRKKRLRSAPSAGQQGLFRRPGGRQGGKGKRREPFCNRRPLLRERAKEDMS